MQAEDRSDGIRQVELDSAKTYEFRVQVGRPLIRSFDGLPEHFEWIGRVRMSFYRRAAPVVRRHTDG